MEVHYNGPVVHYGPVEEITNLKVYKVLKVKLK